MSDNDMGVIAAIVLVGLCFGTPKIGILRAVEVYLNSIPYQEQRRKL